MNNRAGTPLHPHPKHRIKISDQQKKLAHGVLSEGKSFRKSAVDAGYTLNTANLGERFNRIHSAGIDMAFLEASEALKITNAQLVAMSKARLAADISRGKSSGVERSIEVLGKFKDLDWFVRTGDIQIGILAGLTEDSGPILELKTSLDPPEPQE